MGTVGGELCQRPRCWYFRNGFVLLGTQGDTSLVRNATSHHAIFDTDGPLCLSRSVWDRSLRPRRDLDGQGPSAKPANRGDAVLSRSKSEQARNRARANEILTTFPDSQTPAAESTYEIRHRHGL